MSEATQKREAQGRRQSPMSARGHFRRRQRTLPSGPFPLGPKKPTSCPNEIGREGARSDEFGALGYNT